ncbi:MAG: EamA family transporter [Candidatus Woesearchaeota archaeon]
MRKKGIPILAAMGIVVLCTLLTSSGKVLWKFGANQWPLFPAIYEIFGGFVLHAIAAAVLIYLFKKGEVSILFPVFATNYIWVNIFAYVFFGEPLTVLKWAGIFCIIAGAIILSRGSHKHGEVIA